MTQIAGFAIDALSGVGDLSPKDWDGCAGALDPGRPEDPFTTHRFLKALEDSGSAQPRAGWAPRHLVARTEDRRVAGVMPLYVKGHSQGEYVFDHAWAQAWDRAGGAYYPKLQAAVPFTPATGRRLLVAPSAPPGADLALIEGAVRLTEAHRLSSLHITFCTEAEWRQGATAGLLRRRDQQFHWVNDGYEDFDAFLGSLASRKRKQLRKERAAAVENGVEILHFTGDALEPEHWDAFWGFYQDTARRKWGRPYLTRAFFDLVQDRLSNDALLILCRRAGRWIAGALNFIGRETLYGRYWGAAEDHKFLHFETCYYQAIDAAIALGLKRVEAGAQGAHKLARGYLPAPTYSLHYISDPNFRRAVDDYLAQERAAVGEDMEILLNRGPFRKGRGKH